MPTENSIQPSDTCTYKNYLLTLSTSIPNSDFVIILLFEDKDLCGERYSGNEQGPENRKNAEKMAIRVERRISDEGDGQENRIAASSVKFKENKAGWNFYQGQGRSNLIGKSSAK